MSGKVALGVPLSAAEADALYAVRDEWAERAMQNRERYERAEKLVVRYREALPPDPDSVPQWGVDDYREAVRNLRRAALGDER